MHNLTYEEARDALDLLLIKARRTMPDVKQDLQDQIVAARREVKCAMVREYGVSKGTELQDIDLTKPHKYIFEEVMNDNDIHCTLRGGPLGPTNVLAQRSDFLYLIDGEWLDLYKADREA